VQSTAQANAYAERLIGSIRRECLDHIIIVNECGLRRALAAYIEYYNRHPSHRVLSLAPPVPSRAAVVSAPRTSNARISRRDRLEGVIHEYSLVA
jgi:putative transposase